MLRVCIARYLGGSSLRLQSVVARDYSAPLLRIRQIVSRLCLNRLSWVVSLPRTMIEYWSAGVSIHNQFRYVWFSLITRDISLLYVSAFSVASGYKHRSLCYNPSSGLCCYDIRAFAFTFGLRWLAVSAPRQGRGIPSTFTNRCIPMF